MTSSEATTPLDQKDKPPWYYWVAHYVVKVGDAIMPALDVARYVASTVAYGLVAYGLTRRWLTASQVFKMLWPAIVFGPRPTIPQMASGLNFAVVRLKRNRADFTSRHRAGEVSLQSVASAPIVSWSPGIRPS